MPEEPTTKLEKKVIFLPCQLTDEEIIEKAKESAELVVLVESKTGELARAKTAFNDKKKVLEEDIETNSRKFQLLSAQVDSGEEKRDVDCEATFDYEAGKVTVKRLDTDEVIEEREMTEDEDDTLPMPFDATTEEPDTEKDADGGDVEVPTDGDNYPDNWPEEEEGLGD